MQSWRKKKAEKSPESRQSRGWSQRARLEEALHPKKKEGPTRGLMHLSGFRINVRRKLSTEVGGSWRGAAWDEEAKGQHRGSPGVEGAAGGLPPPAETAGAGGPALKQHPWLGRAGRVLRDPSLALWSPPRPLAATPDQSQAAGEGACHRLGAPSKEEESRCGGHRLVGHTWWVWRSLVLGRTVLPPKDASSKAVFLCFGAVQAYALSGKGSEDPRWWWLRSWSVYLAALRPCGSQHLRLQREVSSRLNPEDLAPSLDKLTHTASWSRYPNRLVYLKTLTPASSVPRPVSDTSETQVLHCS